jgi:RNA polymerase sigma factor (sigma-70 family)
MRVGCSKKLKKLNIKQYQDKSVEVKQDNDNIILWQQFKEGNESAFNALLHQYYSLLLNYGVRLVSDKQLVKDCLHDFFVDIWTKRAGLGDVKMLKAYLIISFRRRLLREKSKNKRLQIVDEAPDNYDFEVEFNIESEIIVEETKQEISEKLKYHISALTKRQREAVYLRFYQDLDYPQVAEIMEISHPATVNLVYSAIKVLRQHLNN